VGGTRIRVTDTEPLRRRRLVVFLRLLLLFPHYIVLSVWALLLIPVVPFSWLAVLILGRLPKVFHRFLAAYLRYQGQVTAWLYLLSATYPDPLHTREHPFRIEVRDAHDQPRLVTLFRLLLAIPAIVLASVFNVIMTVVGVGAWFVALALGRTTAGLQELGTFCLRYQLETQAYLSLLTASYPRLEPPPAPVVLPTPELE
jgi:fatty acid desaturase